VQNYQLIRCLSTTVHQKYWTQRTREYFAPICTSFLGHIAAQTWAGWASTGLIKFSVYSWCSRVQCDRVYLNVSHVSLVRMVVTLSREP